MHLLTAVRLAGGKGLTQLNAVERSQDESASALEEVLDVKGAAHENGSVAFQRWMIRHKVSEV